MGDPEGQNRLSKALIAKILFPEELAHRPCILSGANPSSGQQSLIGLKLRINYSNKMTYEVSKNQRRWLQCPYFKGSNLDRWNWQFFAFGSRSETDLELTQWPDSV